MGGAECQKPRRERRRKRKGDYRSHPLLIPMLIAHQVPVHRLDLFLYYLVTNKIFSLKSPHLYNETSANTAAYFTQEALFSLGM